MSFCQDVKTELCKIPEKNECCEKASLYAYLVFSRTFPDENVVFTTENKFVAEHFAQSLAGMMGTFVTIHTDLKKLRENIPFYTVLIEDNYQRNLLCSYFSINKTALTPKFIDNPCCASSFFRGLFLLSGTVTNPEKEYHLEIQAPNNTIAEAVFLLAQSVGINFKITKRKQYAVLYLKESEQIEDFLTLIGSSRFALKLMDVKVMKNVRNKVNRLTNCETANLSKTVNAANAQVNDIMFIKERTGLGFLDEDLRELATLRLENPELSLRELTELLTEPLSRSGVNHRLKRISEVAEKLRNSKS